ncbi:MAG: hypothetical protein PHU14_14220 [Methylovulum sp.]|nr:hypothetical protein [Methylovulum sp.]
MPQTLHEQFMEYIAAFEEAEWVTAFDLLVQGGMELPSPEALDDTQLTTKLWEVIRGLAMLRMFLACTNHLSDRELYDKLWHDVLREEGPLFPANSDTVCHIDLIGSGSEEDEELYLRYYANEKTRNEWGGNDMPARQAPPFDRDRHLPSAHQAEWHHSGQPS